MRNKILAALLALPLLAVSFAAAAADPTGRWKTIDDETGRVKSIVEVSKAPNGSLTGRVVEIVNSNRGPNPLCEKCTGSNKDKPVKGMTILWNLKPDGANEWAGGTILDPAKGKTYKAKAELMPNGGELAISGCVAFICRSQTWIRE